MQFQSESQQTGFTLIELLIVIAIVGILASIAVPAYNESITKSRRVDAQGVLMNFANTMERHFTSNNTYEGAAGSQGTPTDTGSPWVFSTTSPTDSSAVYYNLTISAADGSSYTLLATAVGAQADNGNLELTSTGIRRWDRDDDNFGGTDNCWEKTC